MTKRCADAHFWVFALILELAASSNGSKPPLIFVGNTYDVQSRVTRRASRGGACSRPEARATFSVCFSRARAVASRIDKGLAAMGAC